MAIKIAVEQCPDAREILKRDNFSNIRTALTKGEIKTFFSRTIVQTETGDFNASIWNVSPGVHTFFKLLYFVTCYKWMMRSQFRKSYLFERPPSHIKISSWMTNPALRTKVWAETCWNVSIYHIFCCNAFFSEREPRADAKSICFQDSSKRIWDR